MKKLPILKHCLLLTLLSLALYLGGNDLINLTNPDEVFYTQTAREMAQHQTWMTPILFDQPQFEKPILLYWLLRIAHSIFGETNFAARFFPAIFGVVGVLAVYLFGLLAFRDKKPAYLSSLILMTSALYIGLAKTVFTDLIFSVFILLTLLSFYWAYARPRRKTAGIILSFIFCALAVLTKGPLGFTIPYSAIITFLFLRRELKFLLHPATFLGIGLCAAISVPWYAFCIQNYGQGFIQEFFFNDHLRRLLEAEHIENDTWFYYPLAAVMCMFPWTLFVAAALFLHFKNSHKFQANPAQVLLGCWIINVFITFQVAHSKLTSYIMPMFPAMALITGDLVARNLNVRSRLLPRLAWLNWAVLCFLPLAIIGASRRYPQYIPSMTLIYSLIAGLTVFIVGILVFLLRKKYKLTIYGMALVLPLLLVFTFGVQERFDTFVSSKTAVQTLLREYPINNTILCSKFLARGVRHYSDKPVAVIDINGSGYFSPHPIPYLNTFAQLLNFLRRQSTTFCVVTKSAYEDIKRTAQEQNWEMKVLHHIGDEYLLRVHAPLSHLHPDVGIRFTPRDRVLILAPHPDDEAIATGGVIQEAVKQKAKVKVVLFTNGDNNELAFIVYEKRLTFRKGEFLHMGEVRRKESLDALSYVGVFPGQVISLGYPDFGTMDILTRYWGDTRPYRSMFSRVTQVAYPEALSPNAPYVGQSILLDLKKIIRDYQPTHIFVSHPADVNRDHRSLYVFLQVALWDLDGAITHPKIFPYLIHVPGWPKPRGHYPDIEIIPPDNMLNNSISWQNFELTREEAEKKKTMISFYKSQNKYAPSYLCTFARRNELFSDLGQIKVPKSNGEDLLWQTLISKDDAPAPGRPYSRITFLAYAVQNDELLIKMQLRQKIDKAFGVKITLLGYNDHTDFAKMPKIILSYGMGQVHLRDKLKKISPENVKCEPEGRGLTFHIPLSVLGNPDRILTTTAMQFGKLPLDETAWRILQIN